MHHLQLPTWMRPSVLKGGESVMDPPVRHIEYAKEVKKDEGEVVRLLNDGQKGSEGKVAEKKGWNPIVQDLIPWVLNVFSSVVIVMVNKLLMGAKGYLFRSVVTLTGAHFFASATAMHFMKMLGYLEDDPPVPTGDLLLLVVAHCLCVALLNISLMVNTVGFYQMAKLLIVPFVCLLEYLFYSKSFSIPTILSITVVVLGVGVISVTNITASFLGFAVAMLSVFATGIQQTKCSAIQKKHGISSFGLLLKAGFPMGISLLLLGPLVDRTITGEWISSFDYSIPVISLILLSSAVAILVNLSAFMCLGRFSPVSFQVMGHIKTVLVLTGGFLIFSEELSMKQMLGITSAVAGMICYGFFTSRERKK